MSDFSSQIALFRREKCEILNEIGLPPDIDAFWRQAAQPHFLDDRKIAQMTTSGFFMSEIEPLGELGHNVCALRAWSRVSPYQSPPTEGTSRTLADCYEQATGRPWDNQQGQLMLLFEVAIHAPPGPDRFRSKAAQVQRGEGAESAVPRWRDGALGPVDAAPPLPPAGAVPPRAALAARLVNFARSGFDPDPECRSTTHPVGNLRPCRTVLHLATAPRSEAADGIAGYVLR